MSDEYDYVSAESSHRRSSVRKGVLRNFVKFRGKELCQSLFFNKVAGRNATGMHRAAQVFSCEFYETLKNTFSTEHLCVTASRPSTLLKKRLIHQLY